jgi:transcription initiation factor IIE alpha subunit
MNIDNFIKSKTEQVIDTDENINIIILIIIPQEHLKEIDDEIMKKLQILIRDVLKALNKLIFYEEIYYDGNPAIIIALAKYKKQLDERQRHHQ